MALQTVELKPVVAPSAFSGFWKLFSRNRMAVVGLIMLIAILTIAIFAPLLAPYDPKSSVNVNSGDIYNPPSPQHWLGTDDAGRDILSGFLFGARVSLTVGFFAAFISVFIG